MLHSCSNCNTIYLVSHYSGLCNYCGSEIQQRIELLSESDGSVEWWILAARAEHGESVEVRRRWRIG